MSFMSEDNFSMSADKYLAKHKISVYLEDSITQLLEHREDNPKVNPAKFLCEYFCSLRDGNHTMFREFNFIKSTPHNRASFIVLFWKCFRQIGKKGDLLSIHEYHSLMGLLCADFPFQLIQKTARIVLIDDALDCLISFSDFIYAFQVQFYYEEFLEKCVEIYQNLLQTMHSPRDPVIVPTSGQSDAKVHQSIHLPADGADAMQFFRAVYPILDRADYSTPPLSSLKEILYNVPRISFYEFLMAIAKSEFINSHIGRLPSKAELLEGADIELTTSEADVRRYGAGGKSKHGKKAYQSPRPPLKGSSNSRPTSSTTSVNRANSVSSATSTTPVGAASGTTPTASSGKTKHHHHHQGGSKRNRKAVVETDSDSDSDSSDDSSDTI